MSTCRTHRLLLAAVGLAACATPPAAPTTSPGPAAAIPTFAAGDARVNTPGFVAQTLRLNQERDGVRYTLMAFAVGDTLTLGAMVKGSFRGTVRWTVGSRRLELPFDTAKPGADAKATVDGAASSLVGKGAEFRGTAWTNVELPLADWLHDGTALRLEFAPTEGQPLALPDAGHHFVAQLEHR